MGKLHFNAKGIPVGFDPLDGRNNTTPLPESQSLDGRWPLSPPPRPRDSQEISPAPPFN